MASWKNMSVGLKVAIGAAVAALVALVAVVAVRVSSGDEAAPVANDGSSPKRALALGKVSKIGSRYNATITAATLYLGEEPFLAATIKTKFVGTGSSEPLDDLDVEYSPASNLETFGETTCGSAVRGDDFDEVKLSTGEVATGVLCVELPANSRGGGTISISEIYPAGNRTYWSTEGAATKRLPSRPETPDPALPLPPSATPTPTPTPTAAPAPAPRRTVDTEELEEQCDELNEDVEDYKDAGEDFKSQWRKNKARADDDQRDDYEDWLENYEDQLDRFEDLQERC